MSKSVLITGGAGFIGSHLAELLLGQGCAVHIVDDLSTGRRENIAHLLGDRCRLTVSKVADLPGDLAWAEGVDEIYHLAAAVGVKLIVDDPVGCIETNLLDTIKVLRAAAPRRIPILITSSSEVYGKSDRVPFGEDDDVTYGSTVYSRWSYAMAKALDEHLALAHVASEDLPVVIVRLFNTVGPRQTGRYGMVVPRFIEKALANEPIEIYGSGRQTRCFCHVGDVVPALVRLLARPECYGRVFNLGSDEEVSVEQLADRVIELTGSTGGKRWVDYDQAYQTRFDDLHRRVPDLTRIKRAIGFEPTRDLDAILEELIALARRHRREATRHA
jgi:UDP-glucose 4-epimerase